MIDPQVPRNEIKTTTVPNIMRANEGVAIVESIKLPNMRDPE